MVRQRGWFSMRNTEYRSAITASSRRTARGTCGAGRAHRVLEQSIVGGVWSDPAHLMPASSSASPAKRNVDPSTSIADPPLKSGRRNTRQRLFPRQGLGTERASSPTKSGVKLRMWGCSAPRWILLPRPRPPMQLGSPGGDPPSDARRFWHCPPSATTRGAEWDTASPHFGVRG